MSILRRLKLKWWAYGLTWGSLVWMITWIIIPLFKKEQLSITELLFSLVFWLGFGLFWGWVTTPREDAEASDKNSKPDLP